MKHFRMSPATEWRLDRMRERDQDRFERTLFWPLLCVSVGVAVYIATHL